jgi:G3E family GTPase
MQPDSAPSNHLAGVLPQATTEANPMPNLTIQDTTLPRPIPLLIVTGFLGAGKTTLMRRLVRDAHRLGHRAGVIVNEFGALDVDSHLLREADAELLSSIAGGCACCTGQDELHWALEEIAARPTATRPELILLETSGAADPVVLLDVLTAPQLLDSFRIAALVCVADATLWSPAAPTTQSVDTPQRGISANDSLKADVSATDVSTVVTSQTSSPKSGASQTEATEIAPALRSALGPLLQRQVQLADTVLLNKADLVAAPALAQATATLHATNPQARILPTHECDIDLASFADQLFGSASASIAASTDTSDTPHHHFQTLACPLPHPVERAALEAALAALPATVLRIKGFVHLRGSTGLHLLQYTGGTSEGSTPESASYNDAPTPAPTGRWTFAPFHLPAFAEEPPLALVFIGSALDPALLSNFQRLSLLM